MEKILHQLRIDYPYTTFEGGERAEGFWIMASDDAQGWVWARSRMASAVTVALLTREALTAFYGA